MSKQRGNVHWSKEQDQMIIALRGDKTPWNEISERVGRSVEACSCRYRKILPQARRVRSFRRIWTAADEALLEQLVAEKVSPVRIAAKMNKTRGAVNSKIQAMRMDQTRMHFERVPRIEVPQRCLDDRDRRLGAELSLTAEFFGDPRPGQSALDKKQGAFHAQTINSLSYRPQGSISPDCGP